MASATLATGRRQPAPAQSRPRPEIKTGVALKRDFITQPFQYQYLATMKKGSDGRARPMLSGLLQANLIFWIGRKTYGGKNNPEWADLSITDLAELCGGVERKSVAVALADLLRRRIIATPDRNGCAANAPKMYKLCPENWRTAPPYEPEADADADKARQIEQAKAIEAAWAEKARQADAEEAQTVAPGKVSRPAPVAIAVKNAEPVHVRIVYHSEFDQPIAFRARAGKNGRLQVTACKPCSRPQPHEKAAPEENTALSSYRDYLFPLVLKLWGVATDDDFVRKVFASAQGAPVETLADVVRLKLPNPDKASYHVPGLLVNLAEQAGRTHRLRAELAAKEEARKMPAVTSQSPPEPLNPARRWDRIRQELKGRMTPESYGNWFARTRQIDEDDDTVTVLVDGDQATVDFITDEYHNLLNAVCEQIDEPTVFLWRAGQ
jgi:hypothetical protein